MTRTSHYVQVGRLSRRQFAMTWLPVIAMTPPALFLALGFSSNVALVMSFTGAVTVTYLLLAGRLNDVGLHPALALLGCLIWPFAFVIMLWPGMGEPNKYGPPPYARGVVRRRYPRIVGIVNWILAVAIWSALILLMRVAR